MLYLMSSHERIGKFAFPSLQCKAICHLDRGHPHIADNFFKNRDFGLNRSQRRAVHGDVAEHAV